MAEFIRRRLLDPRFVGGPTSAKTAPKIDDVIPLIQPKQKVEEGLEEEVLEESGEASFIEDDTDPASDIAKRAWRLQTALAFLPKQWAVPVGAALWWMVGATHRDVGCSIWVGWLGEQSRPRWHQGFEGVRFNLEGIYQVAQQKGWRYPLAVNLNRLHEMTERAEAALVRRGMSIYQSGGRLVTPVKIEVDATKGRKTTIAVLSEIQSGSLKAILTEAVDFFKWKDTKRTPCGPPNELVAAILGRYGKWRFPQISGVITAQTLRRDGTVLDREGFDSATGLFVMGPLPEMKPIPAKPTKKDAEEALELWKDAVREFPWCDEASRAGAISALITPNVRAALTCAPMHGFSATGPGSGKSYAADMVAAGPIGDAMATIASGGDEEETEKRLGAMIMSGARLFSFDNVTAPLGGDALAIAIERPTFRPRILGKSEVPDFRNGWSINATGNNLRLREDMSRRTILNRMDAGVEQAEDREFEANPLEMILADRGKYIRAALIIPLAYRAAGMPGKLPSIGDPFDEWSDNVRSPLVWLGMSDPVETKTIARERDVHRIARLALLQTMFNAYGDNARTAKQMINDAKAGELFVEKVKGYAGRKIGTQPKAADLEAAIIGYTDSRLDPKWFGQKLATDVGKITEGLRLQFTPNTHTKINDWWVEQITKAGAK
jgi:putative DNA primase/helicase